jgi:hypothetical protein
MKPRFPTNRRALTPQSFFLILFVAALSAMVLVLVIQPGKEVEGQDQDEESVAPDFTPEVSLGDVDKREVEEGGSFRISVLISPTLLPDHRYKNAKVGPRTPASKEESQYLIRTMTTCRMAIVLMN